MVAHLVLEQGGIVVKFVGVRALQGELVQALGQHAADADGGQILRIDLDARDGGELGPQFLDDLVRRRPLTAGNQADEDAAGIAGHVGAAGPDGGEKVVHVRVFGDDGRHLLLQLQHGVEGNALGRLGEGEDGPLVFGGEETHGHGPEQDKGQQEEQA